VAAAQVKAEVPQWCRRETVTGNTSSSMGACSEGNLGRCGRSRRHVFLPPRLHARNRRYPVVYALHGYSIGPTVTHEIDVPQTIEGAFAQGARHDRGPPRFQDRAQRLHVLQFRHHRDFEQFIARDLVAYIDAHYRTIPIALAAPGRPFHGRLCASRIGMKHPDVFGSLYIMSHAACRHASADQATPPMTRPSKP